MSRLGRWWKRESARPGVTGQFIYIGGVTAIAGLLALGGAVGGGVELRAVGALVLVVGLALIGLAVHRTRR